MTATSTIDRLTQLLTEPLARLGLDLEFITLSSAGKRRVLKVAVDKDGGVQMDDVAEATRAVSEVLDDSDVMGEMAYTLEVSSPGVDRPLTLPRHWRRNATRLVKVTTGEGDTIEGRILESDEEAATLDVRGEQQRVDYADVAKALIQIEFKREG